MSVTSANPQSLPAAKPAYRANAGMHLLLTLFAAFVPVLVSLLLIVVTPHMTPNRFYPFKSDEITYWHQIATFREAGFNGGYYAIDEIPARAAFSHFATKGPVFPVLYGTIARIVGWYPESGGVFNSAFMTLGLLIFIAVSRPTIRQLLLISALLATFWPVLLYLFTMMQEGLQFAVAALLAGIFYVVIRREGRISLAAKVSIVLFIFAASMIKGVTWAFLLLPFLLLTVEKRSLSRLLAASALAALLIGAAFIAFSQISLPRSAIMSDFTEQNATPILGMIAAFGQVTADNLYWLLQGNPVDVLLRVQVIALIVVFALYGLQRWQRRADDWQPSAEIVFHSLNLFCILAANLVFYRIYDWLAYRIMAPHLLLSALLLLAFRRYKLLAVLIASNLLLFPQFFWTYQTNRDDWFHQSSLDDLRTVMEQHVVYDPAQTNAWCNTIMISSTDMLGYEMMAIPAGIGISRPEAGEPIQPPLRSRYLILSDSTVENFGDQLRITLLSPTRYGGLYLNLDANCE